MWVSSRNDVGRAGRATSRASSDGHASSASRASRASGRVSSGTRASSASCVSWLKLPWIYRFRYHELSREAEVTPRTPRECRDIISIDDDDDDDHDNDADDPLQHLPEKAYNEVVADLLRDRQTHQQSRRYGKRLVMHDVAGPAVLWAYFGVVVFWTSHYFVTWLSWSVTPLPSEFKFAKYPSWLVFVFMPFLLCALFVEWKCLTFVIVPRVQWVGNLKVCGFNASYGVWIVYQGLRSCAAHMDVATNGFFFSSMLRTLQHNDNVLLIWAWTMQNSLIPMSHLFKLGVISALIWSLMSLQLFVALLTLPLEKVSYEPGSMSKGYVTGNTFLLQFCCPCRETRLRQFHPDVLMTLAGVNRMVSVLAENTTWLINRGLWHLDNHHFSARACAEKVSRDLDRVILRFLVFNFMEKALQLEIQTTVFAISRALESLSMQQKSTIHYEMILSIVIGFVMAVDSVGTACADFYRYCLIMRVFQDKMSERSEIADGQVQTLQADIRWKVQLFAICILIFCITLLHTVVKFVMCFECQGFMWNTGRGCVDMSKIHAELENG